MSDKAFDKKLEKIATSEPKTKKETKEMKKLTINPQVKGALKLIAVALLIALGFYLGVKYQSNFDQSVTQEVVRRVSQLKISQ